MERGSLLTDHQPMMCVEAPQLLAAADEMDSAGHATRTLRNGVTVTSAQLRAAGEALRDGPQPVCNGLRSNMPGFIDRKAQPRNGSLVFTIGVLPSRTLRITKKGTARDA